MNTSQCSAASSENLTECLDMYRKEAEQKIENMKDLLRKAKITIDKQKAEIVQKNEVIEGQINKYAQLESVFQKYLNEEKKTFDASQVLKVLASVDVDGINWICLKCTHSIEWIRESELQDLPNDIIPSAINQQEYERMKENYEKIQKQSQSELQNVINQYEERMKRLKQENEVVQRKFQETLTNLNQTNKKNEENLQFLNEKVSEIIDESQEIRENCLGYMAEENDEAVRKECMNKVKLLLIKMQKSISANAENDCLNTIKEHVILLQQTLFEALKKQHSTIQDASNQEKQWEDKYKQLSKQKEAEKAEKEEILSQGRKMIKDLQKNLENLKIESQKQIKERDIKIEFLQQEMKKNVNIQYIKNILIKFFNSDQSVKERTLPVIQTVLQFSQAESEILKNAWLRDQSTVRSTMSNIGKMFSFGSS
ncbi:hypothetical protein ABPG74_017289 [Tetrahymena malaccensis]